MAVSHIGIHIVIIPVALHNTHRGEMPGRQGTGFIGIIRGKKGDTDITVVCFRIEIHRYIICCGQIDINTLLGIPVVPLFLGIGVGFNGRQVFQIEPDGLIAIILLLNTQADTHRPVLQAGNRRGKHRILEGTVIGERSKGIILISSVLQLFSPEILVGHINGGATVFAIGLEMGCEQTPAALVLKFGFDDK